jgi:pimeloyl-ACP methyl ester carboxylesterase
VVLPGQYLERPTLVDVDGVTLEALYHRGERPPALLLCPPLGGEGMDAPLLAELAWAAAREGHASLRFQHRGRGASQGAPDHAMAVVDALAALEHLRETAGPLLVAVGLGSGCGTALRVAERAGLRRAVLLAPEEAPPVPPGLSVLVLLPEAFSGPSAAALAAAGAPGGGRVEVVEGVDPAFRAGLPGMARRAVSFVGSRG